MHNAIDFSYARPTVEEVSSRGLDILIYTGNAIPPASYLRDMRAAGVAVCMIQETDPNRAQQGYSAGVADSNYANGKANYVNYPLTASICFVVSDGSATNPNYGGDQIAQYAAGVQANSPRPFFFYGNRYAVDHAMRGAPNGLGCWVPSTWGANASDLLVQEANIASPIANTDLNTVHRNYGAWGQTSTVPPAPPKKKDDDPMLYVYNPSIHTEIWCFSGNTRRHVLPDEWDFCKFVGIKAIDVSTAWFNSYPVTA